MSTSENSADNSSGFSTASKQSQELAAYLLPMDIININGDMLQTNGLLDGNIRNLKIVMKHGPSKFNFQKISNRIRDIEVIKNDLTRIREIIQDRIGQIQNGHQEESFIYILCSLEKEIIDFIRRREQGVKEVQAIMCLDKYKPFLYKESSSNVQTQTPSNTSSMLSPPPQKRMKKKDSPIITTLKKFNRLTGKILGETRNVLMRHETTPEHLEELTNLQNCIEENIDMINGKSELWSQEINIIQPGATILSKDEKGIIDVFRMNDEDKKILKEVVAFCNNNFRNHSN